MAQIDEQHQQDISAQEDNEERLKTMKSKICQRRLIAIRSFAEMPGYGDVWKNDGSLNLNATQLTKRYLVYLLKTFNVEGRAKISAGKKDLIQQKLQSIDITQSSVEKLEIDLVNELEGYGLTDDFLDQSFATNNTSFTEDNESAVGDDTETSAVLGSETSAGDSISDIDSDDTELREKIVTFDDTPMICNIPSIHSDSSSSSVVPKRASRWRRRRSKQQSQNHTQPLQPQVTPPQSPSTKSPIVSELNSPRSKPGPSSQSPLSQSHRGSNEAAMPSLRPTVEPRRNPRRSRRALVKL